ncbi:phosphoenolpyruvate--protein phosphotransferase [Psychromonas sp.]|uniref:phosphoenolpyruvate--protein phosphotransferase n=1 Tax=Psychromonas sp. TaxID=1884585 RepID=UPI003562D944
MNNFMFELTRITHKASLAKSPNEQVQLVVSAIKEVINVDVCTIYRRNSNNDMALLATHGLPSRHPIIIPQHLGLVGLVAESRHTLNITEPAEHPDYYFIRQSDEQAFHSFCGTPLVDRGEVIGVLVVQSRKSELLGQEQEAFVSTLASHLALLVSAIPQEKGVLSKHNLRSKGLSGASGTAIGKVQLVKSECLMDFPDSNALEPTHELAQWRELKTAVAAEMHRERDAVEKNLGGSLASIADIYQVLLADRTFGDKVESYLGNGLSLLTAIKHTVRYFSDIFQSMNDPYLRARRDDMLYLGDKLYQVWLGKNVSQPKLGRGTPIVLIGNQISVSDIISLPADQLVAIVCFSGAALSHISVFANALGIPAVMGTGELKGLKSGEQVIVDGNIGQIIRNPSKPVLKEYKILAGSQLHIDQKLQQLIDKPAMTTDGVRIELFANSGLQADIMPGLRHGADGIGLFRTEIPFMVRDNLPSEEDQIQVYQQVIKAYDGKPVYIRTLDVGGDKPLPYLPVIEEENPALGWRGVRFTLANLQLMMTQLRAIIRAAEGQKNIHILLPMLSSTAELDKCIELVDMACMQLSEEGVAPERPKIGIMVEVPAVIPLLQFWHKKIDFISIGSNDLSQYLLATDRNNPFVGKLFDSLHPAVIHELQRIVQIAETYTIPLSLCGEMGSDPVAVMLLIGLGVRRVSLSSSKLPLIKWIIRSLSTADAQEFTRQALLLDNAAAIRQLGYATLANLGINIDNNNSINPL